MNFPQMNTVQFSFLKLYLVLTYLTKVFLHVVFQLDLSVELGPTDLTNILLLPVKQLMALEVLHYLEGQSTPWKLNKEKVKYQ